MVKSEQKKRILITGISKGIGREMAIFLNNKNYSVTGTCRNPETIPDKIPGVNYLSLDLSKPESIKRCAKQVGKIDVLINNAGHSQLGAMEDTNIESYRHLYEVALFGTLDLTKQILPGMRLQRKGLIIFIGSLASTFPLPYFSNYCSVKAAIKNLSYSLRAEVKQFGVDVCLIEPSDMKTSIIPDFAINEQSEYSFNANKVKESVAQKMQKADSPVKMAKLTQRIIETNSPKARYVIGGVSPILSFCKRFVSDAIVEKTILKMYKVSEA